MPNRMHVKVSRFVRREMRMPSKPTMRAPFWGVYYFSKNDTWNRSRSCCQDIKGWIDGRIVLRTSRSRRHIGDQQPGRS